ncbi:hypothetical protein NHX12_016906, partial [Muraenolepis orangiensis]
MLGELQGIVLCRGGIGGASILQPRPLEERGGPPQPPPAPSPTNWPRRQHWWYDAAEKDKPPFVYTRTPVDYQRRLDLPSLKQTDNPVILELKGGSLSTFSRRVLSHLRNLQANLRYLK